MGNPARVNSADLRQVPPHTAASPSTAPRMTARCTGKSPTRAQGQARALSDFGVTGSHQRPPLPPIHRQTRPRNQTRPLGRQERHHIPHLPTLPKPP